MSSATGTQGHTRIWHQRGWQRLVLNITDLQMTCLRLQLLFQSSSPTPLFISHSELRKTLSEVHIPVGSLLHKCMSAEPENLPAGTTQMQPHGDHGPELQRHKCMSFYHTHVELDEGKLYSLENVTKTQCLALMA